MVAFVDIGGEGICQEYCLDSVVMLMHDIIGTNDKLLWLNFLAGRAPPKRWQKAKYGEYEDRSKHES